MRKNDAFVAKIVNTRLTKILMAIFALAERLPTPATLAASIANNWHAASTTVECFFHQPLLTTTFIQVLKPFLAEGCNSFCLKFHVFLIVKLEVLCFVDPASRKRENIGGNIKMASQASQPCEKRVTKRK